MDTWIWQGGYPLVSGVDPGRQHVVLSQRRFLFDGEDDGTRWAIPVIVRQRHGDLTKEDRLLLDGDDAVVGAPATPTRSVVVNAGQPRLLPRRLRRRTSSRRLPAPTLDQLSTPERYSLVDDTWSAVVAGALDAASFVPVRPGLRRPSGSCRSGRCSSTGCAGAVASSTATSASGFQAFVRELVGPDARRPRLGAPAR